MRSSFSPTDHLIADMDKGYDQQYLLLVDSTNNVKGMICFNEDSMLDDKGLPKVKLFHISAVNPTQMEEVMSLGLEYIW